MILLGLVLLVLALLLPVLHVLFWFAVLLIVVGLVLNLVGGGVGGRRWY